MDLHAIPKVKGGNYVCQENQGPFLSESVRFLSFLVEQAVTLKNIRDELLQHGVRALSYMEFSNMQRMIASVCGLCYCKVGI